VHGVFDSAGHGTLALSRTALLPSVQVDAVGSLDYRFRSSIPSPHMPLSNASSAASRLPSHGSGSGWSLLLSCVTLAFTTPCRFIPTLSNLKGRSTDRARAHFLRRTTLGLLKLIFDSLRPKIFVTH